MEKGTKEKRFAGAVGEIGMTQQNEAIRLAVKKLEYLEGWQAKDGASVVPEVAAEALTVLRPLLDQTSAGVGDELPCAYWTRYGDGSGRIFEDKEDAEYFVRRSFTKDIEIVPVYTRAITQADHPAGFNPALYNRELHRLEFQAEDATVIYEPISGTPFSIIRKNGTSSVIGFTVDEPLEFAQSLKEKQADKDDRRDIFSLAINIAEKVFEKIEHTGDCHPSMNRYEAAKAVEIMLLRALSGSDGRE